MIDLLNQHLSAGTKLSEPQVLHIFSDVSKAVARLHHRTKPIIHRDLKVQHAAYIHLCKSIKSVHVHVPVQKIDCVYTCTTFFLYTWDMCTITLHVTAMLSK